MTDDDEVEELIRVQSRAYAALTIEQKFMDAIARWAEVNGEIGIEDFISVLTVVQNRIFARFVVSMCDSTTKRSAFIEAAEETGKKIGKQITNVLIREFDEVYT